MTLILSIGGLIIVASWSTEEIGAFVQTRLMHRDEYLLYEWQIQDTLQLLRRSYDDSRQVRWSGPEDKIPITLPGQLFMFPIDHNRCGSDFNLQSLNHARPLSDVADISATGRARYTNLGSKIDEEDWSF